MAAAVASLDFDLPDLAATARLARAVAERARGGDTIALWGSLGAGKTSFARAFIRARPGGADVGEVPSPTFTLVQVYDLPGVPVWHFDLYRLGRPEDAWELGIEDAFATAIALIEWPDRLGPLLPDSRLDVELTLDASGRRRARVAGRGDWIHRLDGLHA
jgi:tRNA threonylcarbamoyladenosine biosynthesis protein TsaE